MCALARMCTDARVEIFLPDYRESGRDREGEGVGETLCPIEFLYTLELHCKYK